jgi:hypothetical protein
MEQSDFSDKFKTAPASLEKLVVHTLKTFKLDPPFAVYQKLTIIRLIGACEPTVSVAKVEFFTL